MKPILSLLIFIFLISNSAFSQYDSIVIGSSLCGYDNASGTYKYLDMLNGKPRYSKGALYDCSQFVTSVTCNAITDGLYYIQWNGSSWEWTEEANGCIWLVQLCVPRSSQFIMATSSSNTALPPCSGWVADPSACEPVITTGGYLDLTTTNNSPELTANATSASYQWLDCNNNFAILSDETGQTFTATASGNYAVEVTQNGCKDTSACESVTVLGLSENDFGNAFAAYPNPNNGPLIIDLGATYSNVSVIVRNQLGVETDRMIVDSQSSVEINITGEAGIYLIEITGPDKKRALMKVVKE